MIKNLISFVLILGFTNIFAQQTGEFTSTVNWDNELGPQSVNMAVYVPANYNASNNYALIIGFHGQGDTGTGHLNRSNSLKEWANDVADFGNVIVACPNFGYYNNNTVVWENNQGIIKAIRDLLAQTYNIDYGKVFSQGFSYGGKSAYIFGLDEADIVAGILAYSPAFYGVKDLYNQCSVQTCTDLHYDINYSNFNKAYVCTSAGGGAGYSSSPITEFSDMAQPGQPSEFYATPVSSTDNPTGDDSFFLLAYHSQNIVNQDSPGHAVMYASQNTTHTMPTMNINKLCWDFVQQGVTTEIKSNIVQDNNVKIYPNPAKNYITVEGNISENIQILDVAGKLVLISQKTKAFDKINITMLKKGIYFIKIGTQTKKFIKE